jgi:hypothetical protein
MTAKQHNSTGLLASACPDWDSSQESTSGTDKEGDWLAAAESRIHRNSTQGMNVPHQRDGEAGMTVCTHRATPSRWGEHTDNVD